MGKYVSEESVEESKVLNMVRVARGEVMKHWLIGEIDVGEVLEGVGSAGSAGSISVRRGVMRDG